MRSRALLACAAVGLLAVAAGTAQPGGGWPQYLGPSRDGTAAPFTMPAAPRLSVAWRTPILTGSASFIAVGGRAYTLGSDTEQDYVLALDAATGKELWRGALGPPHADAADGPGSTPALAGDAVIAVGSSCRVHALAAADGRPIWQKDLAAAYKTRFAARGGCSMSPLVTGDLVILPTGAATDADRLVALDVRSGAQRWAAAVERSTNASPGIWTLQGASQVVYHHLKPPSLSGLTGVMAENGTVAWTVDAESGVSMGAPLPLPGGRVLLQTWSGSTVYEVPAGPSPQPTRLWSTNEFAADNAPPVAFDGHLYGFGGNSGEFLLCVEIATGRVAWRSRIYRGSVVLVGGTLIVLSESAGTIRLVAASPTEYRELARLAILPPGAKTHTPPAFAGGRIFARNLEEAVAVDVR